MVGGHADRRFELRAPGPRRLRRARIDQVEGEAREGFPRELDRAPRLGDAVDAAERLQRRIVERLHAERKAVDARRAIAAKALRLGAAGIGFERDLGVGGDRPESRDRLEHRRDRRRLHQRRRAAAEEDRW